MAQDLAQEAWIRILRGLPEFRGDSLLSSWIHRVTVNTALAVKQSEQRRHARDDEFAAAPQRITDSSGKGEHLLLRMELERALDQLPDGMRRVIVLHDLEGYTHEEIAEAMSTTPSTSRSQLGRARAKLRNALDH